MRSLSVFFSLSFVCGSILFADSDEDAWNELNQEMQSLPPKSDKEFRSLVGTPTPKATPPQSTCSTTPNMLLQEEPAPSTQAYSFYGDMLYWKPSDSANIWALKLDRSTIPFTSETKYTFDFDWDFGFRIGFNYKMPLKSVMLDINWTRFHTVTHNTHQNINILEEQPTPTNTLNYNINLLGASLVPAGASYKVTGSYALKWDQIDLSARKKLSFDHDFNLIPFGGIRMLINHNTLKMTRYTDFWGGREVTQPPTNKSTMDLSDSFISFGLMGGLGGEIYLGRGFNVFLMSGGSIGSAVIHGHNKGNGYSASLTPTSSRTITRGRQVALKSMFDVASGFDWKRNFNNNSCAIGLSAAYEFHVLFNSPTFTYDANFSNDTTDPTSNLQLQGLTIRGSIIF